jgi:hypothetical protein
VMLLLGVPTMINGAASVFGARVQMVAFSQDTWCMDYGPEGVMWCRCIAKQGAVAFGMLWKTPEISATCACVACVGSTAVFGSRTRSYGAQNGRLTSMKEGVYQADLTSVNLWQGAWGDRLLCYVPMALWQNMMMAWLAAFGESAFVVADGFDVDALDAGRERLPA